MDGRTRRLKAIIKPGTTTTKWIGGTHVDANAKEDVIRYRLTPLLDENTSV